ncbi:MAG: glycosyltransferase [Terriglobia bacterium]
MSSLPRVLVLSRSYPNNVTELLGLWVRQVVAYSTRFCDVRVISPVPWCPPVPGLPANYSRFRAIDRTSLQDGIQVFYPRFFLGPGYSLYSFEWAFYYAAIRRLADRIRKNFPYDLIHAHFTYPDGAVAVHLGKRYGIPVVITEHIPWGVWDGLPRVKKKASWAVRECQAHLSVSHSVRASVEECVGRLPNLHVVPNGVDGDLFRLPQPGKVRKPGQLLFVGAVRPVKGADILLKAIRLLLDRGQRVSLVIAGEPYYDKYRQEETRLRQMVTDLRLENHVSFVGKKMPGEVAQLMGESAVLVLPSRIESFGMVLVEALACGTPVVATRCGGPEDIVNDRVGVLVPIEDPEAMASGIEQVLSHQAFYRPDDLRAHALNNFGLETVGNRIAQIYEGALGRTGLQAPLGSSLAS